MLGLLMQEYNDFEKEFGNVKKEYAIKIQGEFEKTIRSLSGDIPKDVFFSWTQFTPSFNDGDICYFSVYADELSIEIDGDSYDELYELEDRLDLLGEVGLTYEKLEKLHNTLSKLILSIPEDIMEEIYGDGVIVSIGNNKVEVECHDHY